MGEKFKDSNHKSNLEANLTQNQIRCEIEKINSQLTGLHFTWLSFDDKNKLKGRYQRRLNELHEVLRVDVYKGDLIAIAEKIEYEYQQIERVKGSGLSEIEQKAAVKKHGKNIHNLTREQEHMQNVNGVVALFDDENYLKLQSSSKPGGFAELVHDTSGNLYLTSHGCVVKELKDGKEVEVHYMDDEFGKGIRTSDFIERLIAQGKIPNGITLNIASCYGSAIDTNQTYSNNVSVKPVTNVPGVVVDTYLSGHEGDRIQGRNIGPKVVAMTSEKSSVKAA